MEEVHTWLGGGTHVTCRRYTGWLAWSNTLEYPTSPEPKGLLNPPSVASLTLVVAFCPLAGDVGGTSSLSYNSGPMATHSWYQTRMQI